MKHCFRRILLLGGIFILGTATLLSQEVEKKIYYTAFTQNPPEIDGLLKDSCWDQVDWGGDFIQITPYENQPPSQQTSFKILYDNDNLYVFICAYDTEVDKVRRILSRRDDFSGDFVEINIDSYFDKQTAFSFTAMASGTKGDEFVSFNGNSWDANWNPVWYLKTSMDDKGWYAEMKIPLSQLRFGNKEEHVWGIQLLRHLYRDQERSNWQYIPKGSPGFVHLFGELHGIKNIKPKRQVELMPYALAKLETFEEDEGNPFATGRKYGYSAGIDGKVGITNDLTLDFTVNPDFGQVEADPSEVNLSAFESYFSERRPFFVEGNNIYQFRPSSPIVINDFGMDNLFYSRRIGRYPHHYPETADNEYVDMPEATRILAALKLSGKTKKGVSIGVMESITANEFAEIDNDGERREENVEPLTNYFVGRLQKDFNKGETMIGAIVTAVNRDLTNPEMNYLLTRAYTGGIDFEHNWKDRVWYIAGKGTFSNIRGNEEALTSIQTSSARYFQRPDASHVSLDSTLTALSGYGGSLKFGKRGTKKIRFETSITFRSPGQEFNDVGYMRFADMIHHGTWLGYQIREPFSIFRNFYLNLNYWMYWNFEGKLLSTYVNMNFNSQFKNKWFINGSITRAFESISTSKLRGGPSFRTPGSIGMNLNLSSDYSKKVSFYLGNYHSFGDQKSGYYHDYWTGITVRPMNSLSLSLSPSYSKQNNELQYIEEAMFNDDTRYIFAQIDQQTIVFSFRLNYTITPDLSVQYYGQPFVSSGKYTYLKRITDPQAENYTDRYHTFTAGECIYDPADAQYNMDENGDGIIDYSVSNPDFNFRQFRSNLVIRWEYSPGSTAFFVWSQGRTSTDSNGIFSYDDDIVELFSGKPHNVFLIKFNYWFSL